VLTIGSFDGVHQGHAALIAAAKALAAPHRARVVAMAFDPHPLTALNPPSAPGRLTTWPQRQRLLLAAGADEVVRLPPSPAMLALTAEEFVAHIVRDQRPLAIVEGPDFRFGRARAGDNAMLAALGQRHGFAVRVLEPVEATLDDHSVVTVSSSLTRWLLRQGRVRDAWRLLARPYTLVGEIVRGDRRGRTIGFPTANIHTPLMLPGDGVYAARAVLDDARVFPAAVNIGPRPTFPDAPPSVEAHLILPTPDAHAPWAPIEGLPEYGWSIRLELCAFLRDQAKFPGLPALRAQLARDVDRARTLAGAAPDLIPSAEAHA
jgi:riboflavin kinase/FMN adenylyltransferase